MPHSAPPVSTLTPRRPGRGVSVHTIGDTAPYRPVPAPPPRFLRALTLWSSDPRATEPTETPPACASVGRSPSSPASRAAPCGRLSARACVQERRGPAAPRSRWTACPALSPVRGPSVPTLRLPLLCAEPPEDQPTTRHRQTRGKAALYMSLNLAFRTLPFSVPTGPGRREPCRSRPTSRLGGAGRPRGTGTSHLRPAGSRAERRRRRAGRRR